MDLFVRFAAFTGLRAGELVGLRVKDLQLMRRRVRVTAEVPASSETHGVTIASGCGRAEAADTDTDFPRPCRRSGRCASRSYLNPPHRLPSL
jgi:hypothetical protein